VVMMDPATNRSRGFGFICFSPGQDGTAALSAALEQYNNHYLRGKWIEVKSAAPTRQLVSDAPGGAPVSTGAVKPTVESQKSEPSAAPSVPTSLPPPPGLEGLTEGFNGEPQWPQCLPAAPQLSPCSVSTYLSGALPSPLSDAGSLPSLLTGHHSRAPGGAAHFEPLGSKGEKKSEATGGALAGGEKVKAHDGMFDASQDLRRSLEQLLRLQAGERIGS